MEFHYVRNQVTILMGQSAAKGPRGTMQASARWEFQQLDQALFSSFLLGSSIVTLREAVAAPLEIRVDENQERFLSRSTTFQGFERGAA
jgi:hypothetical protein